MTRRPHHAALAILILLSPLVAGARQAGHPSHHQPGAETPDGLKTAEARSDEGDGNGPLAAPSAPSEAAPLGRGGFPLLVRPSTLAAQIEELAGHSVRVVYARVVGVLNPRAFRVDTSTRLPPVRGHRARLLVLVEQGGLAVPPASLVSATVTIAGTARTLLGMQVSREVPWPAELRPESVERLEVRGGVLATSVRTAEGVELTSSR